MVNIEKNKKNTQYFALDKNNNNIINDEEIMKCTPHFTNENENKTLYESVKDEVDLKNLKIPITPNSDEEQKVKIPLTGNNKGFANHKFTFNFETKENGVIIPKFGDKKEEKKIMKITNGFRIANKNNGIKNKNKFINLNKQQDNNKKIYSTKDFKYNKKDKNKSPLNTSINSSKDNQESPLNHFKRRNNFFTENYNSEINNNKRCNIFDNKKRIRTSRPKSVKNISPKKQSFIKNRITESDKEKDKDKDKYNKDKRKKYNSSNKKTLILPYLNENKQVNLKNKLENELSNLFKILPENYQEDSEINNQINLIINDINELKECIYKNNKIPFGSKRNFSAKGRK